MKNRFEEFLFFNINAPFLQIVKKEALIKEAN